MSGESASSPAPAVPGTGPGGTAPGGEEHLEAVSQLLAQLQAAARGAGEESATRRRAERILSRADALLEVQQNFVARVDAVDAGVREVVAAAAELRPGTASTTVPGSAASGIADSEADLSSELEGLGSARRPASAVTTPAGRPAVTVQPLLRTQATPAGAAGPPSSRSSVGLAAPSAAASPGAASRPQEGGDRLAAMAQLSSRVQVGVASVREPDLVASPSIAATPSGALRLPEQDRTAVMAQLLSQMQVGGAAVPEGDPATAMAQLLSRMQAPGRG